MTQILLLPRSMSSKRTGISKSDVRKNNSVILTEKLNERQPQSLDEKRKRREREMILNGIRENASRRRQK